MDYLNTNGAAQEVALFRGRCVWCSKPYAAGDEITAYRTNRKHGPEFDAAHPACHRLTEAFFQECASSDMLTLGRATQELLDNEPSLLDCVSDEDAAWLRARFPRQEPTP